MVGTAGMATGVMVTATAIVKANRQPVKSPQVSSLWAFLWEKRVQELTGRQNT